MRRTLVLVLCLLGCAEGAEGPTLIPGASFCPGAEDVVFAASDAPNDGAPLSERELGGSACAATEREYAIEGASHLENCTLVSYGTNPPSSGAHYGDWAAFATYENPVPRGFYVHAMEHGAVVVLYSCDDCADEVAEAQAMIDALPEDPACSDAVKRRVILTPDPLLEARWAAAAWGFTLEADCFEAETFSAFVQAHYAAGPENFCAGGVRPEDG